MTQILLAAAGLGTVIRPFWVIGAAAAATVLDVLFSGRW